MGGRSSNSYDFVRFCAACGVLFSHHFALADYAEPPVPGYGENFGQLAVEVFFCLSGFLICRSLQKDRGLATFLAARMLRIFPNLTFALLITSTFTLLWFGNYAHVWSHLTYVINNFLMFLGGVTYTIPGVFTDAHVAVVNGPLWSLPSELWLYLLLFVLFSLISHKKIIFVVCALYFTIVWAATSIVGDNLSTMNLANTIIEHPLSITGLGASAVLPIKILTRFLPIDIFQFSRLGSYFMAGSVWALLWDRIEKKAVQLGLLSLFVMLLVCQLIHAETFLHPFALAGVVIGLGNSKAVAWFSKCGDPSYGMYIFAWPVQQFSLLLVGSFWLSMLAAFIATTLIGYATWHGFEKRAMAQRRPLAEGLLTLRGVARLGRLYTLASMGQSSSELGGRRGVKDNPPW